MMPPRFHVRRAIFACAAVLTSAATLTFGTDDTPATTTRPAETAEILYANDFDREPADRLPEGWVAARTAPLADKTPEPHEKDKAVWEVVCEKKPKRNCYLALTRAPETRLAFNLCVLDLEMPADVSVAARCWGDYGVGVVLRYKDDRNYYLLRITAMEGNIRLYKVVDGRRTQLASARLSEYDEEQWYRLTFTAAGGQLTGELDGRPALSAHDDALTGPGRIGVWTRAGDPARFDDISVREIKPPNQSEPEAQAPAERRRVRE
jgi:hypothetical protein